MSKRESKIEHTPDDRETLVADEAERARIEAENALKQFDAATKLIDKTTKAGETLVLRPSVVCDFNRLGIQGIWRSAGVFRAKPIIIGGSKHTPPPFADVPRMVEEMCDYVNGKKDATPIHIGAYLMWRINWIHPFVDGNGRTSRTVAYVMLCNRLGFMLPGVRTIPDQISENKDPYYECLDAADQAWKKGVVDVGAMERYVEALLARQLLSIHNKAAKLLAAP